MSAKVYFKRVEPNASAAEVSAAGRSVLAALLAGEAAGLMPEVPVKVHFGEKGSRTYLRQEHYAGVLDLLQESGTKGFYCETSVLYGGERFSRERHLRLAAAHGFDRLPVVIADGANGEDQCNVPVPGGKHFQSAAIARILAEAEQTLVLSHFKGHMLAGIGGAVKQLSMGFAAKGGKMAMHLGVKPRIKKWKCRSCGLCATRCNAGAITQEGKKYRIDREKCIGCGACFSICPAKAVSVFTLAGLVNALTKGRVFREKLVEYALASHHGKRNIYVNFAVNVTPGCDCEPRPQRRCVGDIGVFASLDPVAVDSACYAAAAAAGKKFRGYEQLVFAEKIALGSRKYELIEL